MAINTENTSSSPTRPRAMGRAGAAADNGSLASEPRRLVRRTRARWAAIGAAIAVTLGLGGLGVVGQSVATATVSSGERLTFVSIDPCRLVDLRPTSQTGPRSSPLGPNETFTVTAHGSNGDCAGVPTDARAVGLNVTALDATAPTFLTLWSAGTPRPTASSLNPVPGQPPTPNAVTTRLSTIGQFDVFNLAGSVNVIIDLTGYYVDHDHDDRYDTKAQVDDKIAAQLGAPSAGPEVVDVGPFEADPILGSSWSLFGAIWIKNNGFACIQSGELPVVAGQSAESVSATVLRSSSPDAQIDLSLLGINTRPGPTSPLLRASSVLREATLSVPESSEYIEISTTQLETGRDRLLEPGWVYVMRLCSNDALSLAGMRATFTNP